MMGSLKPKFLGLATLTAALISTSALAGGFSRGGVNIDQLFDQDRFSSQAKVTYVNPKRTIKDVARGSNSLRDAAYVAAFGTGAGSKDLDVINAYLETNAAVPLIAGTKAAIDAATPFRTAAEVDVDGDFWVPSAGIKTSVTDSLNCLATYSEPTGADANYGAGNAYSPSVVEFSIDTQDYGLTCGYSFVTGDTSVGEGKLTVLGGVSYLEFDGFLSRQSFLDFDNLSSLPGALPAGLGAAVGTEFNLNGLGLFSLSDTSVGWRAGVAYEIPDIALRAQLVYNSEYEINATGTVDISGFGTTAALARPVSPIAANFVLPQSIEAKVQSGIREGTLAFASFKWEDWSKLGSIPVTGVFSPLSGDPSSVFFEPLYRDGYTVSAGIGQVLSENVSGLMSLTWDRGTATTSGTQTDSWTLSGGLRYSEGEQIEVSLGGAIGILEGGTSTGAGAQDAANAVTYNFDADYLLAGSASMKYKF